MGEKDRSMAEGDEQDEALNASSKAVLETLNPERKSKIELAEVLERIESIHRDDGGDEKKRGRGKHVKKVIQKLLRAKGGKALEESDMKKLNQRFLNGHLPRLKRDHQRPADNEEEEKDEDDMEAPEAKEGITKMILRYAVSSARAVGRYAEKSVSRAGRTWMLTLLPTGQISTLVSFLLFSYVMKAAFLSWFIPLATLAISVCVMLVSSIRLVRGMKRFAEFKAWAEFLDSISLTQPKPINTNLAEENYVLKHMSPYVHFIIATAFCVMGYGTSDKAWVLNAELGILSSFMYALIIYIYGLHRKKESMAIFACQVLRTLLRGFRCSSGSEIFGSITSVNVPLIGVAVNISLSSALRTLVICGIASLSRNYPRNSNVGVHLAKVVFPHIVAVAWWDVADLFFCYSTPTTVLRASVEYIALLFAMPIFALFLAYTLVRFLLTMELSKALVTLSLVAVPTLYFKVWKNKGIVTKKVGKILGNTSVKSAIMVAGITLLGYFMVSYRPSGLKVPKSGLKWEDYRRVCFENHDLSVPGNEIPSVVACREFKGYDITWEGLVENVAVVKIENKVSDLLNLLPHSMATWLSCVYGHEYPTTGECAKNDRIPLRKALCAVAPVAKRPCHIQKYNLYHFRVRVAMGNDEGMPVFLNLDVSHDFYDLVTNLKGKSPIRFSGTIAGDGPTISTKVLFAPSEDDEMKGLEKRHKRIEKSLGNMLDEALDALYDFVLYPVVSFDRNSEAED